MTNKDGDRTPANDATLSDEDLDAAQGAGATLTSGATQPDQQRKDMLNWYKDMQQKG